MREIDKSTLENPNIRFKKAGFCVKGRSKKECDTQVSSFICSAWEDILRMDLKKLGIAVVDQGERLFIKLEHYEYMLVTRKSPSGRKVIVDVAYLIP